MSTFSGNIKRFSNRLVNRASALTHRCLSAIRIANFPFGKNLEEAKDLVSKLQCHYSPVEAAGKEFEKQFMKVLHMLEKLDNISTDLNKESDFLLDQSQSAENPVRCANRVLTPFIDFINTSAYQIDSATNTLSSDQRNIDQTLSLEKRLTQTISQLTYVRTLFQVEAAPLDQNVQIMFSSLIEEIHRLQTKVVEIFDGKFTHLRQHKATIEKLVTQLKAQAKSHFSALKDKKERVDASVEQLNAQLDKAIHANAQLKHSSQTISTAIGEAIIALQSQDIINQKLHHIFEISAEMDERFASIGKGSDNKERCRKLRFVENASIVVSNQIQSIQGELIAAEDKVRSSFSRISDAIHDIGGSTKNQEKDENQCEENLLKVFSEIESSIIETESIAKNVFDDLEPIRGIASNVTELISELSSQLHLIGLNAEIHSAHAGGGTGLETLSSKTSHISLETRKLCKSVSSELDSLVTSLNDNTNNFESLSEQSSKQRINISETIPEHTERITQYSAANLESESKAHHCIKQLIEIIASVSSGLDLKHLMIEELQDLEQDLRLLSETAKHEADGIGLSVDIPEIMSGLMSRYTMESEKAIHRNSLGIDASHTPTQDNRLAPTESFKSFGIANDPLEMATYNENRIESNDVETVQRTEKEPKCDDNVEFF